MPSTRSTRIAAALLVLSACSSVGGGAGVGGTGSLSSADSASLELVRAAAVPITGAATDYDSLMALIGDARFVLLGEATHGTQEFYQERARITQRLIQEKGFSGVAIEGEWPDAQGVHRFVRDDGGAATAEESLRGFTSGFPQWMWANTAVRDLVVWMRQYNAGRPPEQQVGFYGLDVYSLFESADSVVAYLSRTDPAAAGRARERYECLRPYRGAPERYAAAAGQDPGRSCEEPSAAQAREMEQLYARGGGDARARDERFSALQNARIVAEGEAYWRAQWEGGPAPWNARDRHMAMTLEHLGDHLAAQGRTPRIVVWAHNTHAGDARLTAMGQGGEWNVGQLMRVAFEGEAILVGFTTYHGTVLAAEDWDGPARVRRLNPALPESYSALFHRTGLPAFLMTFRGREELSRAMGEPRLERAVGVIYRPRTERQSHYFTAMLSRQFDAVIHIDSTTAVTALPVRR
ncbi:MAG: erythromycin esterase family protein [Gemmatimonadetes bacterium]|nr:erythromycin esterase family protein [Gemmatimonadota bacterium]